MGSLGHLRALPLLLLPILVLGGDIVHEDDEAPKQPGCSNNFVLVRFLSEPLTNSSKSLVFGNWAGFLFRLLDERSQLF